jgi:hypothetical protein
MLFQRRLLVSNLEAVEDPADHPIFDMAADSPQAFNVAVSAKHIKRILGHAGDLFMDHLSIRLKYLLHLYSGVPESGPGDATLMREQFRKDLEPLVAQYGQEAVIEALDKLPKRPNGPHSSLLLH